MRRDLLLAVLAAWLLVFARTAVFILYPQSFFDSDQAIVGLMAKHLIEGRAFPLFFYGQTYLLGVEAWVAALVFLVAGPTVAALHTAILSFHLAAATLLIVGLVRWGGLRPFQALAASLFFTFAPPFTSALLIEANGANAEPFVFVLLLWVLRDRPLWFGVILGVGVLNREFTVYAVPALLAIQLVNGTLFRAERLRAWLLAGVAFLAISQSVDALTPFADLKGPGSRGHSLPGATGSTVSNVLDRTSIVPGELVDRTAAMATEYFPRQIGARRNDSTWAAQGREWLLWPVGLVLTAAFVRAVQRTWQDRRRADQPTLAFEWYLLGVGVLSAAGYVLTRPVGDPIDRYMLLTLYAPVGIVGIFLAREPLAWLRRAMVVLLLGWALVSAVDHARLFGRYWGGGEPDEAQQMADALVDRGVHVAAAGYWRAYKLTFLTRERVRNGSTDFTRIEEYDALARQEGERLLVLQPDPCASDPVPIGGWYLCRAGP